MIRSALVVLLLTVVFCLTLASYDPWDMLVGAVLGSIVLAVFHNALPEIQGKPARELP
jgi:multisubunit Na+/H+ antiporter MnhE subunit